MIRHPANRGYGANRRPAMLREVSTAPTSSPTVHADHEFHPSRGRDGRTDRGGTADEVIGSRLLEDKAIAGDMRRGKWVGNIGYCRESRTTCLDAPTRSITSYRVFSVDFLRRFPSCATVTASYSTRRSLLRSSPGVAGGSAPDSHAVFP